MRNRELDVAAVLTAWPAARPTRGFADRVIAECYPRAKIRRGSIFAAAALVAASILVPLFMSHAAHEQVAAIPVVADLGEIATD